MEKFLILFLVAALPSRDGVLGHSVVGIITDNTTWFLSNLSVRPAMMASLEYRVQYPYVEGRARPIITFYYNGQKSPNLMSHCETDLYGQLRNEDLAVPLDKLYRDKFSCYHDSETWYCSGKQGSRILSRKRIRSRSAMSARERNREICTVCTITSRFTMSVTRRVAFVWVVVDSGGGE